MVKMNFTDETFVCVKCGYRTKSIWRLGNHNHKTKELDEHDA